MNRAKGKNGYLNGTPQRNEIQYANSVDFFFQKSE